MSLARKLQKWVENDLISAEQSANIKEYETSHNGSLFLKLSFSIVGILIGWGICLIIAANWDALPNILRIVGAFSLFALFIGGAYCQLKRPNSRLKEMFLLLCFLMIAGIIGLVGQTFNLEGGWHSFVLLWTVLGLPYVFCSRSIVLNAVWICLFLSGIIDGSFINWLLRIFPWLKDLDFEKYAIPITLCVTTFYTVLDYAAQKIDRYVNKYTVLATSFSSLCLISAYWAVFFCGFFYMDTKHGILTAIAHILVLAYLAFRMSLAVRAQDANAFKRNAFVAELYIFLIFMSCFGNLLTTGVGFVIGGLLLWGLIEILRKTSKYIKGMEIFND